MPDVAHLLQGMHPMREPPPPAPVAPFLIALCAGLALAAVAFLLWRQARQRRRGLRRSAEAALAASRHLPPPERLAAQASLLRRLVRAAAGEQAARAQGEGWLAALDGTFATSFFTRGAGRAYADALYRREGAGDVEALDRSIATLIARLRTRRVGSGRGGFRRAARREEVDA